MCVQKYLVVHSPVIFCRHDNTETYSVETLKPGKIAWQGAPRFQDSSSEEDNVTEETDETKPSPG